ncbi:uncharacterized protein LOC130219225 [Danio aesculapii]|uniref:uncharacterized protein LOC130219225 n=1 Tax=Danio aesculapii TaxID=1142201 RepID=UPI0024C04672|nr:uncharacterized protein LOC130219225 [Danio aesculapii]
MKLTKPSLCFTLTLTLHTMFVTAEALDAEALRVLSVGVRGQSSVSIADLLSGNKEQKQKDGEIVKTPVMTDEGRRLTLVTGPNLCEDDTARQNFTTALFLSSPGPHAVLMLLHLEDPQAELPCDLLQQAQELLGAEVLQYCIVLLQPNQQERLTGASRGIAGDMINACGGRFHIIPDAQTKPAALLEEIDKLVQLNDHRFLSVLTDSKPSQYANGKNDLLSVIYDTLGGAVGTGGLVFCISLTAFIVHTEAKILMLNDAAKVCGFYIYLYSFRFAYMLQYKMTLTKPSLCFTLTLTLHTMFVTAEALDAEALRVLSVGVRGQSSVSIADLLSGNKEQKQKDGEIVKTPVMIDEGRRLTLVTGPNLCEEDTARQNFTTALFLSSPGPHAVLMLLHLEDPQAEPPCDLLQQAQELLGEEVLQYCIVLLQPNQQERLTGASRGIAGDMINACGGRFHIIPDAQTKPAALLEEIDKLVQLNDHRFLSVLTDSKPSQYANGKIDLLSVIYDSLGGAVGTGGLVFCISLTAFVVHTEAKIPMLNDAAKVCGFVLFMFYLRHFLRPDVAIVLNLALLASLANMPFEKVWTP